MCNQIVQFCSNSTKPLLFVGSFLVLLAALALGFTACSTQSLYQDLDAPLAQSKSLVYYLQLLATVYLLIVTILASYAAHYDNKHSIRALAILTAINFVLAAGVIFLTPTSQQVESMFEQRLNEAHNLYDFTAKPEVLNATILRTTRDTSTSSAPTTSTIVADSAPTTTKPTEPMNKADATKIWDKLQARGCCGFRNSTKEWVPDLPKSCCSQPIEENGKFTCKAIDKAHAHPCSCIIGASANSLLYVLALIALVNLYLATVSGVNAYRTFHYNEASQSAYN